MAYNSSGELSPGNSYTIGQYTFSISSSYDSGSDTTTLTASCSYGEDAGEKSASVDYEASIVSWYVEISDNTADVYATVKNVNGPTEGDRDSGFYPQGISYGEAAIIATNIKSGAYNAHEGGDAGAIILESENQTQLHGVLASRTPTTGESYDVWANGEIHNRRVLNFTEYTYDGKTAYVNGFATNARLGSSEWNLPFNYMPKSEYNYLKVGWTILYGTPNSEDPGEDIFVARFHIIPEDADPEDWDDPIDDGDPAYTLKVTIRGALSGRHNDPIYDTSYSYIPADNLTVKDYGCGGDGGYGGGGGAGASTVIVYNYSTSKAGSHETYAYARRHGYGSGGGKGGRGGDGCIIIYW